MKVNYFVCDRCGTDEGGKTFQQIEMRGTHQTQTMHFCEKCFNIVAIEIPELNRIVGRNVKKKE